MTASLFGAYSRYYDLLYRDKNYTGEAAYIQRPLIRQGILKEISLNSAAAPASTRDC